MTALHVSPGAAPTLPLDVLLSAIPSLPRPVLHRLTQRLIERLDDLDGDPDVEPNGDELDGSAGEDDFIEQGAGMWGRSGPGCPISDPPEDSDADRCQAGDDGVFAGPGVGYPVRDGAWGPGDPDDAEHDHGFTTS